MEKTRNTKQKQKILDILTAANKPMSIAEIHKETPDIAKSTIYRNMDALLKQGLIDKYYLTDNEVFYRIKSDASEHKHYVICEECNRMFDLPDCPLKEIEAYMNREGFEVKEHFIQITGTCKNCRNKRIGNDSLVSNQITKR